MSDHINNIQRTQTLGRLINNEDQIALSKVVFNMIDGQIQFPIQPNDDQLLAMLECQQVKPDVIGWVTALRYDSVQDFATQINKHNSSYFDYLTAS